MNRKSETVGWCWLPILAGTAAVSVVSGVDAQPTGSAVEEAYEQSCLAPYRDELAGWTAAQLDGEAYGRLVLAARAAAADSCSAFVERIERDGQPGERESPYLREARDLLGEDPERSCIEARVVSEAVRSAESLFELAVCHSGKEETALLREVVEMDPGHLGSLLFLTRVDSDSQARAEYGESLYQYSEHIQYRARAAKAIIEWAVERGDLEAVKEIHGRFKRDLLIAPPVERCTWHLDTLGLEEVCLEAIESMAAVALAADEALSDRVVYQVISLFWDTHAIIDLPNKVRSEAEVAEMLATPGVRAQLVEEYSNALEYLEISEDDDVEFAKLLRGDADRVVRLEHDALLVEVLGLEPWGPRKAAQAERLKAVLENHPGPLRTAEHHLALAVIVSTWRERIALLRDAVEAEPGHVRARCQLSEALAATGDLAAARRGYQELLADDDGSCNARARLEALDNQAPTEAVSLDEPHDIVVLH